MAARPPAYSGLLDRYYKRPPRDQHVHPALPQRHASARRSSCAATATRCTRGRGTWTRGVDSADFGADFKNEITRPGEWSIYTEGYGETLPNRDNRIWLSHDKPDRWGMPHLNISMAYGDNERAMAQQMMDDAAEMLTPPAWRTSTDSITR